jgi:hypothetical protein
MIDEPFLTYPLLLLLAALCSLDRLGGGTSVGMGNVTCQITSLSIGGRMQGPDGVWEERHDEATTETEATALIQHALAWLPGFDLYELALAELDDDPEASGTY